MAPTIASQAPEPGTGTVWLNQAEGLWWASWQSDVGVRDFEGTQEQAIAWAKEQPATAWRRFDPASNDYVPF